MTAAAIAAQLVDMRNVGTHKVMKLTIHVPEEQALAAIAAFGWPTGVNPVPIAIARLVEKEVMRNDDGKREGGLCATSTSNAPDADRPSTVTPPRQQETQPVDGAKTRMAFRDLRMANQAGILCASIPFLKFLSERLRADAILTQDEAADYVRRYCGVKSRADIRPRTPSGDKWQRLVDEYRTWMHMPEMVA